MHISEIGEERIIQHIQSMFDATGIGDDCAVILGDRGKVWLVSTDALVEHVHFMRDTISPHDLGYKAIAANLSDIAAMGGVPRYVLLSAALPKHTEMEWFNALCEGMRELLDEYNVALVGGDTTASKRDIFLNVVVIGEVLPGSVKYRSTAKVGDVVCVTGMLGDSLGGLRCMLQKQRGDDAQMLMRAHYRPRPHVEEGLFLAQYDAVHAVMDVSDGLHTDLSRMQAASQCGVEVVLDQIPVSHALRNMAQECRQNPYELGAIGGEDYVLLATISPSEFPDIADAFYRHFERPLVAVGRIVDADAGMTYVFDGKPYSLSLSGFQHFADD